MLLGATEEEEDVEKKTTGPIGWPGHPPSLILCSLKGLTLLFFILFLGSIFVVLLMFFCQPVSANVYRNIIPLKEDYSQT